VALAYIPPDDLHAIVDLIGLQAAKSHKNTGKSAVILPFERPVRHTV
jgi:hypothetical protein